MQRVDMTVASKSSDVRSVTPVQPETQVRGMRLPIPLLQRAVVQMAEPKRVCGTIGKDWSRAHGADVLWCMPSAGPDTHTAGMGI
jgi:hypothetical protein